MLYYDPADPRIKEIKEQVNEVAVKCCLQRNAFLDYGFTHEESFELLKLVTTPPIESGFAFADRVPTP